ncbi:MULTISPECIES: hypothetical protein [Thalassospira]|nr:MULTISPECIES: hypothetical protein [Thalassospira]
MTKDIKTVGLVALGVLVAGYIMNVGYGISVVKQASDGFDM